MDDAPSMRHLEFDQSLNEVTGQIVDAAYSVRRHLGAGLLEEMYAEPFVRELESRRLVVETEVLVQAYYKGYPLKKRLRIDVRVDGRVVIELKAVERLHPVHFAQTLTYIRLANAELGFLINFNATPFRDGIHRLTAKREQ